MIITQPVGIDFMFWASNLRNELTGYQVPIPTSEENWREWVLQLQFSNNFDSLFPQATKNIYPDKDSWKKWALFFYQYISSL